MLLYDFSRILRRRTGCPCLLAVNRTLRLVLLFDFRSRISIRSREIYINLHNFPSRNSAVKPCGRRFIIPVQIIRTVRKKRRNHFT